MKAPGTRERPEGEYTMLPMQNEIPRCEIWPRWGRRYPTTKKVKLQTFWNAWISSRSRSFNSDPPTAESRGLRRLEIYNVNLFKLNVLLIFKIKIVSWNDFVINDYTRKLNYVNFVIRFFLFFFYEVVNIYQHCISILSDEISNGNESPSYLTTQQLSNLLHTWCKYNDCVKISFYSFKESFQL